nr:MAG TPA: hypothetical protein [Caudoviricetes sp.]
MEEFAIATILSLLNLAEEKIEEGTSFENQIMMRGVAVALNEQMQYLSPQNKKIYEEKAEEMWSKWYKKVQEFTKSEIAIKILDNLLNKN